MDKPEYKVYRRLTSKSDPKVCMRLPEKVHDDIVSWAEKNARTKAEEIIARLIVTLQYNDEFMTKDRLMRLIYSKKLAYKGNNNNKA